MWMAGIIKALLLERGLGVPYHGGRKVR